MMEYRGYKAQIDFDDESGLFHGEVINTRDGIVFQGCSVEDLRQGLRRAVDEHLERCQRQSADDLFPSPGRLTVRLPPGLHRSVTAAAYRDGKPVGAWVAERLEEAVARSQSTRTRADQDGWFPPVV